MDLLYQKHIKRIDSLPFKKRRGSRALYYYRTLLPFNTAAGSVVDGAPSVFTEEPVEHNAIQDQSSKLVECLFGGTS